jgi:hypothetical protein
MTRPAVRDALVPGSARLVAVSEEHTLVTVECGRRGNRQETRADLAVKAA